MTITVVMTNCHTIGASLSSQVLTPVCAQGSSPGAESRPERFDYVGYVVALSPARICACRMRR